MKTKSRGKDMKKISNIAVIGCGRIAQNAHFPALSEIDGVRVKYACDIIPEKARAMKEKYPALVGEAITDYRVALADPEVEAVFVLTPNHAHYTVTMDALRAGKHVMCEKPVTVSYELSVEMQKEADRQGKILNIGVCNRYQSSVERLAEMNRAGELGKVYHAVCSFRAFRSIPGLGGPFTTRAESGGGVLIDWGVHFVDLILYILGDARVISASAATYSEMAKDMKKYRHRGMWAEDTSDVEGGTNDVDDFVTGFVRTDKGTISINGAWAQNIDRGEMFVDLLGDRRGVRLDYCGQFHLTDGETLETVTSEHELGNMYLAEDEAFLVAAANGEKTRSNIDRVIESMRLLDALYRSAECGEEVRL